MPKKRPASPPPKPARGFFTALRIALVSIFAGLSGTFLSVMALKVYGIDAAGSDGLMVILFMTLALCAYLGQEINLRLTYERSLPPAPPPPQIMAADEEPIAYPPIFEEDEEEPDEKYILRLEDDAVPFSPPHRSLPISEDAARKAVAAAVANPAPPSVAAEAPAPSMTAESAAAFLSHHAKQVLETIAADAHALALAENPAAEPRPVDPFLVFGAQLYLAGAAGELTRRFLLSFDHGRFLFTRMLETLGAAHADAVALAMNANVFATVASYQPMIETGVADATAHIDQDGFGAGTFAAACAAWKTLAADHRCPAAAVALTTRIGRQVLADALTGEDRRRIFRVHDSMIGLAAERFAGRPAARFSDGAVLLFDDIAKAAQAAVFIQQEMDVLEQVHTTSRYQISAGIDQGLVVEAAGNFFGLAILNARRLADRAQPKTICIADVIRAALPAEAENISFFHLAPEDADLGAAFTLRWLPRMGRPLRDLEYREIGSAADA